MKFKDNQQLKLMLLVSVKIVCSQNITACTQITPIAKQVCPSLPKLPIELQQPAHVNNLQRLDKALQKL